MNLSFSTSLGTEPQQVAQINSIQLNVKQKSYNHTTGFIEKEINHIKSRKFSGESYVYAVPGAPNSRELTKNNIQACLIYLFTYPNGRFVVIKATFQNNYLQSAHHVPYM